MLWELLGHASSTSRRPRLLVLLVLLITPILLFVVLPGLLPVVTAWTWTTASSHWLTTLRLAVESFHQIGRLLVTRFWSSTSSSFITRRSTSTRSALVVTRWSWLIVWLAMASIRLWMAMVLLLFTLSAVKLLLRWSLLLIWSWQDNPDFFLNFYLIFFQFFKPSVMRLLHIWGIRLLKDSSSTIGLLMELGWPGWGTSWRTASAVLKKK